MKRITLADGYTIDVPDKDDPKVLEKLTTAMGKELVEVDDEELQDFDNGERKFVTKKIRPKDPKAHADAMREAFGISKKWS